MKLAPSITANCIRNLYILPSPHARTFEAISTDAQVVLQSNVTTSSPKEGETRSQTNSDLTPASTINARLWHRRLAHHHSAAVRSRIDGLNVFDDTMHNVCLQVKYKEKFIRTKIKRAVAPFKLVHSDTCGPFSVPTKGGHLHYIIFVDDYT